MRPKTADLGRLGVRWGALISVLLHLCVAALFWMVLPAVKKLKATPREVPIEIVRPLEKKPEKKKPAKKLTKRLKIKPKMALKIEPLPPLHEPKKEAKLKPTDKPQPPAKPKPPAKKKAPAKKKPPAKQKSQLAKKVEPKPAKPKKAEPKKAAPAKKPPPIAKAKDPKPRERKPLAKRTKKQRAKKQANRNPKRGGRKVKPNPGGNSQISMIQRKLVGRWILQPLKVNLKHRCGRAALSGVIDLTKKRGNRFYGTLRTTIRWARCPPEGVLYKIVLLIRGNRVIMRNSGGGVDRGLIQGNVMILKDPYGKSVWRRDRLVRRR